MNQAFAQEPIREAVEAVANSAFIPTAPYFFVAIVAGIVLAVGFQVLLTHLAVALGLNMASAAVRPSHLKRHQKDENEKHSVHETAKTISTGLGIWVLVTSSLSLFFAAWAAVQLSGTFSVMFGALLGLVIWGLFYLLMTGVEGFAAASLVAGLARAARSALETLFEGTRGLFRRSPEKESAKIAEEVALVVRGEILGGETLKEQMNDYLKKLERVFEGKPTTKKGTFRAGLSAFQKERTRGKRGVELAADTAMQMAGMSSQTAERAREKVENYLRNTGREELNPEGIKRDLENIVSDPSGAMEVVRDRLGQFDRGSIAAILAQRADLSEEQAEKTVNAVMSVVDKVRPRRHNGHNGHNGDGNEEGEDEDYGSEMNLEGAYDYDTIRNDFRRMMDDPRAGFDSLLNRLKSLDRESVKKMIGEHSNFSEDQVEQILSRVEQARDEVVRRAEEMKTKVQERLLRTRQAAQNEAAELAQTAARAAWWTFAGAVASGGAAALGGILPAL
jgi:hypothetical protein